jgi:small basic protein
MSGVSPQFSSDFSAEFNSVVVTLAALDAIIVQLKLVNEKSVTVFNKLSAKLDTAIVAAEAAGATRAQLQPMTDLHVFITAQAAILAESLVVR